MLNLSAVDQVSKELSGLFHAVTDERRVILCFASHIFPLVQDTSLFFGFTCMKTTP